MPDSKRYLHLDAIKRISRLDLRARYIVEGMLSGMHRSPYFGQSIEFRQHREYAAGDDLRHVDWKVWGRQDRLYVKQYESETNLRCHFLVDCSESMSYRSRTWSKFDCASTIAATLAYLALRQQDSAGLITFDQAIGQKIPCRSQLSHLAAIIQALSGVTPQAKTDLAPVLRSCAESLPRRGLVVLTSDLLCEVDGVIRGLRLLRSRGHDVLVFHVLDDDELDFEFSGPIRFEDIEGGSQLKCNPRALRETYLAELEKFLSRVRHDCARHAIDYVLVRSSEPLDAVLAHFLSKRLASMQR